MMGDSQDASTVSFRKVKSRAAVRRPQKRPSSSSGSDAGDLDERTEAFADFTSTAQRRRQLRQRNMIHTTSKKRKAQLDQLADDGSSSASADDAAGGGDASVDAVVDVKFASARNAELSGPRDMGATARSEIDTEHERDAQAQFERLQKVLKEQGADAVAGTSTEKVYKGLSFYGAKAKEDTVKGSASSGLNRIGPIRATQYMRSSIRWDYAPDICKDFKETGYCTFGDSCKFMHDRTDYKHGWQLEREWEEGKFKETKDDEYLVSGEEDSDDGNGNLPFHCFICRESFKSPVVTKCKHYFCEACALNRCRKTKKCAVCDANTEGQFAVAKEILARIGGGGQKSWAAKKDAENEGEGLGSDEDEEGESTDVKPKRRANFLPVVKTEENFLPMVKTEEGDGDFEVKPQLEE